MTHLDLFSGIGGFSKGLLTAGLPIEKTYYSEIDRHAIAVYKHHFRYAEYVGSVNSISGQSIQRPNIITFGSPCQDFSVAGKGAGLAGSKSSLIAEAIRLISECRPDVFIWENVAGAFSTNDGADFWAIIHAFTDIGGYRLEWQLLNTAWVLPQNRERIYLIGHLDGRSRPGVFPFRESDFPHRAANQQIVNCLDANYAKGIDNHAQLPVVHYPRPTEPVGIHVLENAVSQSDRVYFTDGLAPTLRRGSEDSGNITPIICLKELTTGESDAFRIYDSDGLARTLKSEGGGGGALMGAYKVGNQYRYLTEIECERLQGFPEVAKKLYIKVWKKYNYLGRQKNFASAEKRSLKLQKLALSAARIGSRNTVRFAETNLSQKFPATRRLVLPIVHIRSEEGKVEIHNQGKLLLSANSAAKIGDLAHPLNIDDFALHLVRINSILEAIIQDGKAGLPQIGPFSIRQKNGNPVLNWFGSETMQPAKNVVSDLTTSGTHTKSITSNPLKTKNIGQTLPILFSCVMDAIGGCIPKEIQKRSFLIEIDIKHGWTQYGNYDGVVKKLPKTQRYKLCGNAVTTDIVKMVGERIQFLPAPHDARTQWIADTEQDLVFKGHSCPSPAPKGA